MNASSRGCFALVSYIPDPLGSFLDGMRRSLPGFVFAQAHITVLPPRHLTIEPERAGDLALEVLGQFRAFEVSFSSVRRFPSTNVLYLPLNGGDSCVNHMHSQLNTGELAAEEQFDFVPHLTVAGPMPENALGAAECRASALWDNCKHPKSFQMTEIVALLSVPNGGSRYGDWTCLWNYNLASNLVQSTAQVTIP